MFNNDPVEGGNNVPIDVGNYRPIDVENNVPIDVENNDPIDVENNDPIDVENNDPIDVENNDSTDAGNNDPIDVGNNDPIDDGINDSTDAGNNDPIDVENNDPIVLGNNDPIDDGINDSTDGESNDPIDLGNSKSIDGGSHDHINDGINDPIDLGNNVPDDAGNNIPVDAVNNVPVDAENNVPVDVGNNIPVDARNNDLNEDGNIGPIDDGRNNDPIGDGNDPNMNDDIDDIAIALALQEDYETFGGIDDDPEPMEVGYSDEDDIIVEDSDGSTISTDSNPSPSVANEMAVQNSEDPRDRLLQMKTSDSSGSQDKEQHKMVDTQEGNNETTKLTTGTTATISKPGLPDQFKQCNMCKNPADLACGGCYFVVYCSAEHQLEDWKSHQKSCCFYSLHRGPSIVHQGPFRFRKHFSHEGLGFSFQMEALCHIPKNTVISEEIPFFIAPWPRMKIRKSETTMMRGLRPLCLTCFGCCKMLQFNFKTCCTCNMPLCSEDCPFISKHRKNECHYMKQMQCSIGQPGKFDSRTQGPSLMDEQATELFYMDIMILRFILHHKTLQEECGDTEKWNERWAKLTATWKISQDKRRIHSKRGMLVSKNMEATLPLSVFATKGNYEVIWYIFCILEENMLTMDLPFRRMKVLCNATINASHSCAPNSHVFLKHDETYDLDNLLMTIVSGKPIQPEELITISYCPLIFPTIQRQPFILDQYLFWCRCLRCLDPSECDTYINCIKCPVCGTGDLMPPLALATTKQDVFFPTNFRDACYNWNCSNDRNCPSNINCSSASSSHKGKQSSAVLLHKLDRHELESTAALGCYQKTQRFIRNNSNELHSNNHILLKLYDDILKGALFPMVGNNEEHLPEFSIEWLHTLSKAKAAYTAFMKMVCPAFDFQGFPEVNHMIMEMEYYKLSDNNISSSSVSINNYFRDPRIGNMLLRPTVTRPVLRQLIEIQRPRVVTVSSTGAEPSSTLARQ